MLQSNPEWSLIPADVTTGDGYKYSRWYTDKARTSSVSSVKLMQDTMVYAKWAKNPEWGAAKGIEKPDKPRKSREPGQKNVEEPKTGDAENVALWLMLL